MHNVARQRRAAGDAPASLEEVQVVYNDVGVDLVAPALRMRGYFVDGRTVFPHFGSFQHHNAFADDRRQRIHRANLINFCIVPIRFADPADYDRLQAGDELVIDDLLGAIRSSEQVTIRKSDGSFAFTGRLELSTRDRDILLAGGLLSYTRGKAHG